eukprot:Polyplicarium_translucidae@DN3227_c0_g1_i10.p2
MGPKQTKIETPSRKMEKGVHSQGLTTMDIFSKFATAPKASQKPVESYCRGCAAREAKLARQQRKAAMKIQYSPAAAPAAAPEMKRRGAVLRPTGVFYLYADSMSQEMVKMDGCCTEVTDVPSRGVSRRGSLALGVCRSKPVPKSPWCCPT